MLKNKTLKIVDLGFISYNEALAVQESHHAEIVACKSKNRILHKNEQISTLNYLLFCQHPPVYTIGKSGSKAHLLVTETALQLQSVPLYEVNRGGDITYHGPGQLVVYPIVDLENFYTDIHWYLRLLEEAVVALLQNFSIQATTIPGLTGVWVRSASGTSDLDRKICAIGIRVRNWVTMHGLALNVTNDLTPFGQIVPCGLKKPVTSMQQEMQQSIDIQTVQACLRTILTEKFV